MPLCLAENHFTDVAKPLTEIYRTVEEADPRALALRDARIQRADAPLTDLLQWYRRNEGHILTTRDLLKQRSDCVHRVCGLIGHREHLANATEEVNALLDRCGALASLFGSHVPSHLPSLSGQRRSHRGGGSRYASRLPGP